MQEAVIIEAVRTPVGKGKPGGALSGIHAVDLLGLAFTGLFDRVGIDPTLVDDVLVGCVSQVGEQSACPGRVAWLGAGLPESVPATTIDRRCGSSQQAASFAAQGIMSGAYDIAVVAGVESMSRVPMGSGRMGQDGHGPRVEARYAPGLVSQGVAAELIAARWSLSREQLDEYAARSQANAATASSAGWFEREIVPVQVGDDLDAPEWFTTDETIRAATDAESLARLNPVFRNDDVHARFPQISWSVTAGNSSQLADGAAAMLVMSKRMATELGLRPRARFVSMSVVGSDPIMMLDGPIAATRKVLARADVSPAELSVAEVNEAFAPVPLAWQAEFGVPDELLNPRGGAIALGHPLGASGQRLMTTMLHQLEDTGGRYGLQTMCEGGGMANATLIEIL